MLKEGSRASHNFVNKEERVIKHKICMEGWNHKNALPRCMLLVYTGSGPRGAEPYFTYSAIQADPFAGCFLITKADFFIECGFLKERPFKIATLAKEEPSHEG